MSALCFRLANATSMCMAVCLCVCALCKTRRYEKKEECAQAVNSSMQIRYFASNVLSFSHDFVVVLLPTNKEIKFDAIDSLISCGDTVVKLWPICMHCYSVTEHSPFSTHISHLNNKNNDEKFHPKKKLEKQK